MSLVSWTQAQCCAAYQNAVREQKLAAEISAAKRERDFYMGQVDKAKGIEAMAERKRKVGNSMLPLWHLVVEDCWHCSPARHYEPSAISALSCVLLL